MAQKRGKAQIVAGIFAKPRQKNAIYSLVRRDQGRTAQKVVGSAGQGNAQGPARQKVRGHGSKAKGLSEGVRRRNRKERVKNPSKKRTTKKGRNIIDATNAAKTAGRRGAETGGRAPGVKP